MTDVAAEGRIVVGVDGSEPSKQALRWAQFLGQTTGGVVEAVTSWEPFTGIGWIGAGYLSMPDDWDPSGDAMKGLTATVDEVFGEHLPPGLVLTVREGNPPKILMELSAKARLLVVGSRGHGGFSNLLLGSVSAACTEHATCPVLVVHGSTPPPHLLGAAS